MDRGCAQDPITWQQVYIVAVSLLTVALWCFNSKLQGVTGEMGVIGILPLVAFFGFGILHKARDALLAWRDVAGRRRWLACRSASYQPGRQLRVCHRSCTRGSRGSDPVPTHPAKLLQTRRGRPCERWP